MSVVVALVAGLVAAVAVERAMADTFAKPELQRENYRGHRLPTAAGLVLVVAVIAVEGARTALSLVGVGEGLVDPERLLVVAAVVAFGMLGLADDLLGDGRERGLRGHVRAMLTGRASTGFVKLAGGASVALLLAGQVDGDRPVRVLVDAALIALAANMGNLFDRAPGRTAKVGLLAAVPLLVVAGTAPAGVALAVVVGAAAGLLPSDLRERSMLGDTGANALGAALGVATVLVASPTARAVVAAVLLGLTLLSEVVSFSKVIGAVAPLRWLDRLGGLRTAAALVLVALALGTGLGLGGAPALAQDGEAPDATELGDEAGDDDAVAQNPGRLIVVSVPGLTWADVEQHDLPALEAFFADAALADLAPRGVSPRASPGAAYLTISAGTRATSEDLVDGQVLALDDATSGSAAGEIFTRRTGVRADGEYVSLAWPTLLRANAAQPYDAELGLLTETLRDAGVSTSVIGNADGTESIGPSFERQVGLAMADTDGVVPDGHLDNDLLVADPTQPFGLRTDLDVLSRAVADAWEAAAPDPGNPGGGIVLVEASDAARVLRYRSTVDVGRYDELWADALGSADALFARIAADVDPARDTVVVLAPYNRRRDRDLTAFALGGRGVEAGLLRSASTQRAGFLTLVDVAPTLLDRLGIARPTAMEGRPAVVVADDRSGPERIAHLVALNDASRFRERLLTPTTTAVVVGFAAIVALAMFAHTNRWSRRARRAIAFLALVDLALLPMSYVARGFPLEERGVGFYWTVLVVGSLVVAGAALAVERVVGRARVALAVVLGVLVGVIVVDVLTGSRLALSAAFGYSATGNSRLYGVSNYSYGQLASGVCLLAAMVAAGRPARIGRTAAMAMMVATLVLLGAPTLGSDVGGVLAFTPAVLVFWLRVTERRIRLRTLVVAGAATAAAITVFGLLDLARPAGERAHLGRLFERIGEEGLGPLTSIVERKLLANLQVSTSSLWVLAIPLALVLWTYVARFPTRPYDAMRAALPTLPAALASGLVAAVLGSLLNDSGTIVGGVAAMVLGAALVSLLMDVERAPLDGPPAPDEDPAEEEPAAPVRAPAAASR